MRCSRLALALTLAAACAPHANAPAEVARDAHEPPALVAPPRALDALRLPDVGRAALVDLDYGAEHETCFLLSRTPHALETLCGLRVRRWSTDPPRPAVADEAPEPELRVAAARLHAAALDVAGATRGDESAHAVEGRLAAVHLSIVAHARGDDEAARAILATIATDQRALEARIDEDVARFRFDELLEAYAHGSPRAAVRAGLAAITAAHEKTVSGRRARDLARVIDLMIAEDRAPPAPRAAGPIEAMAREALSALRDQPCIPYPDPQWPGREPSERLRALGFASVPLLLPLLGDERVTRCASATPERAPTLQTFGELALDILAHVAGKPLETKEDAVRWWASGPSDDCDRGYATGIDLARVTDGEALADLAFARGGRVRADLIAALGRVPAAPGSKAEQALVSELETGRSSLARAAAARAIASRARKPSRWEPALVRATTDLFVCGPGSACGSVCGAMPLATALSALLGAYPRGLPSVAAEWARASVESRAELVTLLASRTKREGFEEQVLERALRDADVLEHRQQTLLGVTCASPAVGDLAAIALARRAGVVFACDPPADRKRQRDDIAARLAPGKP